MQSGNLFCKQMLLKKTKKKKLVAYTFTRNTQLFYCFYNIYQNSRWMQYKNTQNFQRPFTRFGYTMLFQFIDLVATLQCNQLGFESWLNSVLAVWHCSMQFKHKIFRYCPWKFTPCPPFFLLLQYGK